MSDLLTGVKGKPNHWKSDVLCVLLGFGLDLKEKCSILKFLHRGFVQKKLVPNVMNKCYV